ncbi:DeoR/GlpR family DNA-binding transcription regulator [Mesomycoplasma lagogenitalium]|uniref:DeoR/GlpR family DNA-binding transcription regulator n=1 Tax=Mesomycoplasma lagogenitalium TaxID=171286 RepID=A0ABY8LUU2_9BACT|nr:DeoR/GlpR family DNA-binding transcription regulator [Mesomycoplasma lagogenitalium]WGI37014.1 DeoR/GlpR family DNA-binding transcription regulator [Mesomycoplasma lagogenitalium]
MSFSKQKEIKEYIKAKKTLKPREIERKFDLTKSTTRRYLVKLEDEGFIKRPFGEVVLNQKGNYIDKLAVEEVKVNVEVKKEIAKTASVFAKDYINVYVDGGSSCFYLLEYLDLSTNVYTNSIYNAMHAIDLGFQNVNIIGGKIKIKSLSTLNTDLRSLENLKFQIAFLGVNGIDEDGNLTTTQVEQGSMKNYIAQHSDLVVVLATKEKFGYGTFYNFTPKNKTVLVVTDYEKKKEFEQLNLIRIKMKEEQNGRN